MYHTNIERETLQNNNFRKVLNTNKYLQLVVMSINPNDNIPIEKHVSSDQFIRIEQGKCKIKIYDEHKNISEIINLEKDNIIIIKANIWHEIINTCNENLKLYTIYCLPQHEDKIVQKNKPIINNQFGGGKGKREKFIKKFIEILDKNM